MRRRQGHGSVHSVQGLMVTFELIKFFDHQRINAHSDKWLHVNSFTASLNQQRKKSDKWHYSATTGRDEKKKRKYEKPLWVNVESYINKTLTDWQLCYLCGLSLSPRQLSYIKCSKWRESTLETIATHLPVNKDQLLFNSTVSLAPSSLALSDQTHHYTGEPATNRQRICRDTARERLTVPVKRRSGRHCLSLSFAEERAQYGCCFCSFQVDCEFFHFLLLWSVEQ